MDDKNLMLDTSITELMQTLYGESQATFDGLRNGSKSVFEFKRETVNEAMGYLKQLKIILQGAKLKKQEAIAGELNRGDSDVEAGSDSFKVASLTKKFFQCIPHKRTFVLDLKTVVHKLDMCQVCNFVLCFGFVFPAT